MIWFVQTGNLITDGGMSGHAVHPDEVPDIGLGSIRTVWIEGIPYTSTYVEAATYDEALDEGINVMVRTMMRKNGEDTGA